MVSFYNIFFTLGSAATTRRAVVGIACSSSARRSLQLTLAYIVLYMFECHLLLLLQQPHASQERALPYSLQSHFHPPLSPPAAPKNASHNEILHARLAMTPSAIVHTLTFFGLVLLHTALARAPSSSWFPLQTLAETLEYEPQPHNGHVSARNVLLRASLADKQARPDSFDDATQPFARLHRFACSCSFAPSFL